MPRSGPASTQLNDDEIAAVEIREEGRMTQINTVKSECQTVADSPGRIAPLPSRQRPETDRNRQGLPISAQRQADLASAGPQNFAAHRVFAGRKAITIGAFSLAPGGWEMDKSALLGIDFPMA
jgi:hypothetical protein